MQLRVWLTDARILTGAVILSAVSLWRLPEPGLWLLGIWFSAGVLGAFRGGSSSKRALWFNLAVLLAVIGGGALFFSAEEGVREERSNAEYQTVPDEIMGYRPRVAQSTQVKRSVGDEVIYDVTYTIQEDGLRMGPPYRESEERPCVVFFGGSHVFGEGVNDDEALPYRFGIETGGQFQVHNFGYSGYGTHQMLAALEEGLVESTIDCTPRHFIYEGAYFHIPRAAGLSSWDKEGPYFEPLGPDAVERRGAFKDQDEPDDRCDPEPGEHGYDEPGRAKNDEGVRNRRACKFSRCHGATRNRAVLRCHDDCRHYPPPGCAGPSGSRRGRGLPGCLPSSSHSMR